MGPHGGAVRGFRPSLELFVSLGFVITQSLARRGMSELHLIDRQ